MIDSGFIKLHRSFLQWEWHDDPVRVSVFIHCLLLANWEPKRWHGITIERGTFITSAGKLATICGVSRPTVMKSLKRLEQTGELKIRTSKQGTKITVINYAKYQILGGNSETVVKPVNNKVNNKVYNKVNNKVYTTKNIKKERSIKKHTKKVKVEILPDFYNAEPVRIAEPVLATAEEIEATRELIMKGVKQNE